MSPAVWEGSDCGLRIAECGFEKQRHVNARDKRGTEIKQAAHLTRYDIIKLIAPYLGREGRGEQSRLAVQGAVRGQAPAVELLHARQHGMATPIGLGIAVSSKKEWSSSTAMAACS